MSFLRLGNPESAALLTPVRQVWGNSALGAPQDEQGLVGSGGNRRVGDSGPCGWQKCGRWGRGTTVRGRAGGVARGSLCLAGQDDGQPSSVCPLEFSDSRP